jgi:hypothetical protein
MDSFGANMFAYIAFNHSSGAAMAHGPRAIDALDRADRIGPNVTIEILGAGQAGSWIWNNKIPLADARVAIDAMRLIIDWTGPWNGPIHLPRGSER